MIRRGKTGIGLGALDIIANCLGVLGDGFRVASDGKLKFTSVDGAGAATSLIHVEWLVHLVDEDEI